MRYQSEKKAAPVKGAELAFLKIRYKQPGKDVSKLIEQPVSAESINSVAEAPEATRWALAVAGFGERLRGSPWIGDDFGFETIRSLAQKARGEDEFGLRAEFVQLVRAAESAKSVSE